MFKPKATPVCKKVNRSESDNITHNLGHYQKLFCFCLIIKGLGPALAFQFVMNSTRLGSYETVDQLNWTRFNGSASRSTILCVFWGGVCGVIGSAVGCPLYMIKIQIQSQSHGEFAVGFQHNHSGMIDALKQIYRQNGFSGLFRGFEGKNSIHFSRKKIKIISL